MFGNTSPVNPSPFEAISAPRTEPRKIRPVVAVAEDAVDGIASKVEEVKLKHYANSRRATAINAAMIVMEQQGRTRFNARDAHFSELIEKTLHQLFAIEAEAPPEGTETGATDAPHDGRVDEALAAFEKSETLSGEAP